MLCSPLVIVLWIIAVCIYGSSYAGVAQGLKYFSPGLFQTFRMLFGLAFSLCILGFRLIQDKNGYRQIFRAHFTSGILPILWLMLGGLLNLGIPHCISSIGQQWVPSCAVQLMQPFQTTAGAIFGHFTLPEEHFTKYRFFSIFLAIIGVVCNAIPAFRHAGSSSSTISQVGLGYGLIFIAMCLFGISPPYFKWRTPNVDGTVSVSIQLLTSLIFEFIFTLCFDGPKKIKKMVKSCPPKGWMWPVIVGIVASGIALLLWMQIIILAGSFAANLMPFAQMIIGVAVGVGLLGEWRPYKKWEICLNCVGILFLIFSMAIGFYKKKSEKMFSEEEGEEDEERRHKEEEDKRELEDIQEENEIAQLTEI